MIKKIMNSKLFGVPLPKFLLFGEIVFAGFTALLLSGWIINQLCSNFIFSTLFICIIIWLLALFIGFILFFIILKTRYKKFVTFSSVTIFSIILVFVIISSAVSFYIEIVPPKEVTNQWHPDEEQEIYGMMRWMAIHYGTTYANKFGKFYEMCSPTQGNVTWGFRWDYDESTQVITMTDGDWELLLKLDIELIIGSHYTMTTYYVSDVNFTLFNPLLFDNTTWKGSLNWGDQGR